MKIHTVLSNKQHLEYGVASIPFPIESDAYEYAIGLLVPLEIGGVMDADCFVEELVSDLPVLQILEGQEINVDELDYLAKRLDSFAPYELTQFQAVAAQRGYYKLKDLINLTFCCQEATVVADFSNLEDIGRKHFLITHNDCTTLGLAKEKLRLIALDLLQNNLSAKITPYGVLYDNGMELKEIYDGNTFPQYRYKDCLIEVEVSSGNRYATVYLPSSDIEIERTLERSNINPYSNYELRIEDNALCVDLEDMLNEIKDVYAINRMCRIAEQSGDIEKLGAVIRWLEPTTTDEIITLAKELSQFDFYPGIHTPEDYGRYFIQDSDRFEYDPELADYYDYRRFGKERIAREHGVFDEAGYIVYNGTMSFDEIIERHEEQTFEMEDFV